MGGCGVEVAIEFLHSLFLAAEEVVELLLLDDGEVELDCWGLFKNLDEGGKLQSAAVEGLFEGCVLSTGAEAVEPLRGAVDAVEHEAAEESVFCVLDEGADLLWCAGEDGGEARVFDFAVFSVVATAQVAEALMGECLAE